MGRDTARTVAASDRIAATVAPAPRLFRGPVPRKSPRLDAFRLARRRDQKIGKCVGESGAANAETTVQTPNPLKPDSVPTGHPAAYSSLWVYYVARRETARYDRSIYNGEGAIVTDALKAVQAEGFIPFDAWPDNDHDYYRVERSGRLPQAVQAAVRHKAIGDIRRLTDPDQVLEYLAGGYSVWIGVPWRGGFETRPHADGRHRFRWDSGLAGGHAVELLAYDLDDDLVAVGNSWMGANWGDPERGVAWCPWTAMARELSARAIASGQSEAVVFTEVDAAWEPKVIDLDWTTVL
jgi:hypothetical protein